MQVRRPRDRTQPRDVGDDIKDSKMRKAGRLANYDIVGAAGVIRPWREELGNCCGPQVEPHEFRSLPLKKVEGLSRS